MPNPGKGSTTSLWSKLGLRNRGPKAGSETARRERYKTLFRRLSPFVEFAQFRAGIIGGWALDENKSAKNETYGLGVVQSSNIGGSQPAHTLVIGGTGSGKTRRWIAPAATFWAGPTLVTSTKTELATLIDNAGRDVISRGARKLLWAPMTDVDIPGWERVYWDPVCEVTDVASAISVGSDLMSIFGLSSNSSDKFWESQGSVLLEPMLLAAHLINNDADWVFQKLVSGSDSWKEVIGILDAGNHRDISERVIALMKAGASDGGRRIDSASASASSALASWRSPKMQRGELGILDLGSWARSSGDTLLVVVPTEYSAVLAPAVISLIDAAIRHAKKVNEQLRSNGQGQKNAYGIFMDEMANLSPLPKLPNYLGELRGHGITLIGALQHSSQFKRWGVFSESLSKSWPITLVHAMANEIELAHRVSQAHGMTQVKRVSTSRGRGGSSSTMSFVWEPIRRPEKVFVGTRDQWITIEGGKSIARADTFDITHKNYIDLLDTIEDAIALGEG